MTLATAAPPDILREIVEYHRRRLPSVQRREPLSMLEARIKEMRPARDFAGALKGDRLRLIAEVKKASPSAGIIKARLQPAAPFRTIFWLTSAARAVTIRRNGPRRARPVTAEAVTQWSKR